MITKNATAGNQHFIELSEIEFHLPRFNGVACYARVSTPGQRCKLASQLEQVKYGVSFYAGFSTDLVPNTSQIELEFAEVHSGCDLSRPNFLAFLEQCRRRNLIVAVESIDRLVRHPRYCPKERRFDRPGSAEIVELLKLGNIFALDVPFEATASEIRSAETRRYRPDAKAGRARKLTPELIEAAHRYCDSMSQVKAAAKLGVSRRTIGRALAYPRVGGHGQNV